MNKDNQEPSNHQIRILITLFEDNNLVHLLDKISVLLKKFPRSYHLHNIAGITNQNLGRFDKAITLLQKAINISPDLPDTYYNIAVAFSKMGAQEEAIENYKKAIEFLPTHIDALFNLANCLRDQEHYQTALSFYQKVIALAPRDTDAFVNMAGVYNKINDLPSAEKHYHQALALDPKNADLYFNLGNIKKATMAFETALDFYQKALILRPNCDLTLNNMGNTYKDLNDLEKAENCFHKALEINFKNGKTHSNLGIILQLKDLVEDSIKSYKMAIDLSPEDPSPHLNLANVMHQLGEIELAISSYSEALTLNTESKSIWNNLFFSLAASSTDSSEGLVNATFKNIKLVSQSSLNEFLILKYRLSRGEEHSKSNLIKTLNQLTAAQSKLNVKNPKQNEGKLSSTKKSFASIVAMTHFGRSGTGLMHSLLDNHSQIATLPSIYLSEFFDNKTWQSLTKNGWDGLIDQFTNIFAILFDGSSKQPIPTQSGKFLQDLGKKEGMTSLGKNRNEHGNIDIRRFKHELERLMVGYLQIDHLTFFQLIHQAYENVLSRKQKTKHLFYHIHNPSAYSKLNFMATSSKIKWLVMVREPLQTFESWASETYNKENYQGTATRLLGLLFLVDDPTFQVQKSVGIRLEDLKNHPKETIRSLCRWMNIKEEPTLYEMSSQGKKWWGDPSSPNFKVDGMTPFGKSSIDRKIGSFLSKNDQFILKTLFYPFLVHFKYEKENLKLFKKNLKKIRPMIEEPFDFEKVLNRNHSANDFQKTGSFKYLRSGLLKRWELLNKENTYPNMLPKLDVFP